MLRKLSAALLALAALAFITPNAQAQEFWGQGAKSWGAGVQLSIPTGNLSDFGGIGFGAFGKFQYGLTQEWMLTGSIGYDFWTSKDQGYGVSSKASAVPLLVGAKYNLGKQVTPGFYGFAEVGLYFASYTAAGNVFGIPVSATTSETKAVLCPGVGYQFQNFDVSAKYVINSDISNFAISVAYQLPIK
jgi:hypothetical protein